MKIILQKFCGINFYLYICNRKIETDYGTERQNQILYNKRIQ